MPLDTEPFDFIASFNEPSLEVARILPDASSVHSFTSTLPSALETVVMTSIRRKMKKSVNFRTVTVYYFPRMQGYSSIPSQDGPTLGMSYKHVLVETYDLTDRSGHGINDLHLQVEHVRQKECATRPNAFADSEGPDNLSTLPHIAVDPLHEKEPSVKQEKLIGSMMQSVTLRQRKKLLREAGVTKIDPVEEAEAREIRISRTLCGCNCKVVCRPNTCLCSRSEIPCQVDNGSFPCACSEFSCGNPAGRLQFDLAQVKKQRVLRLAQLQVESSMDRGGPAVGLIKVELIISPAKRTKLSKAVNTRKRVASKKQPFRNKLGKKSSAAISEHLEMECPLKCEEKLETRDEETKYTMVRSRDFFNGRDENDAPFENKVASSEEKVLTKRSMEFRETDQESPNEAALDADAAALDTFQNELNSAIAEDMSFSDETTSCTRVCDLDPEDELDPNCLNVLVIGNENLERASSDTCLDTVRKFQSRNDLDVKHLQLKNGVQLQSNLEFETKRGFHLDSKNDLQPAVDIDLELRCEDVESNKDLQSADDLDLDLECDVSLSSISLLPANDLDAEFKSYAVECCDTENNDVLQTDFTNEADLGAVNNNLNSTSKIDSSIFCLHKSSEESTSCNSLISRLSPNRVGKTDDSDITSQVAEPFETCIKSQGQSIESQGHCMESQGHLVESQGQSIKFQGHCMESQGHYVESQGQSIEFQGHCMESQGHHVESQGQSIEFQGHCMESQGHHVESQGQSVKSQGRCMESQGHLVESQGQFVESQGRGMTSQGNCIESQGHWNVLNAVQVAAIDLTDNDAIACTGEPCDIAAESKVKDFHFCGSPLKMIALQDASGTLQEASSTQSGTLAEVPGASTEEDLN